MSDLVFVVLTVAFFAVGALVVQGSSDCEVENAIGPALCIVLVGYLAGLLFPERFSRCLTPPPASCR
jgi:hypothetical protein